MSFQKEFSVLRQMGETTFVLRGSTLVVEILAPEEIKTASGLVVGFAKDHLKGGSVEAHKVEVGLVLMSGQGYWDEDKRSHGDDGCIDEGGYEPLECQPGAIVILPQHSTQLMSHFPGIQRPTGNKLALVKMDQILAYYPTQKAYGEAKAKLNG